MREFCRVEKTPRLCRGFVVGLDDAGGYSQNIDAARICYGLILPGLPGTTGFQGGSRAGAVGTTNSDDSIHTGLSGKDPTRDHKHCAA